MLRWCCGFGQDTAVDRGQVLLALPVQQPRGFGERRGARGSTERARERLFAQVRGGGYGGRLEGNTVRGDFSEVLNTSILCRTACFCGVNTIGQDISMCWRPAVASVLASSAFESDRRPARASGDPDARGTRSSPWLNPKP